MDPLTRSTPLQLQQSNDFSTLLHNHSFLRDPSQFPTDHDPTDGEPASFFLFTTNADAFARFDIAIHNSISPASVSSEEPFAKLKLEPSTDDKCLRPLPFDQSGLSSEAFPELLAFRSIFSGASKGYLPCTNSFHIPVAYFTLQAPSSKPVLMSSKLRRPPVHLNPTPLQHYRPYNPFAPLVEEEDPVDKRCGLDLFFVAPHSPSFGLLACIVVAPSGNDLSDRWKEQEIVSITDGFQVDSSIHAPKEKATFAKLEIEFDYIVDANSKTTETYQTRFRDEIDKYKLLDLQQQQTDDGISGKRNGDGHGDHDDPLQQFPEPRVDHLIIRFYNLPNISTLIDFSLAFDHTEQRRIDRIEYWDSVLFNKIITYWRLSNHQNTPVARCGDGKRIVMPESGPSDYFSLATSSTLNFKHFSIDVDNALCIIPIPVHLLHQSLLSVPQLDLGNWNGKQFAIYLQLAQSSRLFRYHTVDPQAKWNFFNPLLSLATISTREQEIRTDSPDIQLKYTFTVSGPNPSIAISNIFPNPSAPDYSEFFARLFDNSSTGFLKSFYYVTNPQDVHNPDFHHHINPAFFTNSLNILNPHSNSPQPQPQPQPTPPNLPFSNYNGYLYIVLEFSIKALQVRAFDLMWKINEKPFSTNLLPDLRAEYTFAHADNSNLMIDIRVDYDNTLHFGPEHIKLPDNTPPLPLTFDLQPKLEPFELLLTANNGPTFQWTLLDEHNNEALPLQPINAQRLNNPLLSTIFSPTISTSISLSNILLPRNYSFSLRLFYALKASAHKPKLPETNIFNPTALQLDELSMRTRTHRVKLGHQNKPLTTHNLNSNPTPSQPNNTSTLHQFLNSTSTAARHVDPEPYQPGRHGLVVKFVYYSPDPVKSESDLLTMLELITNKFNTAKWYEPGKRIPQPKKFASIQPRDWRFDDFAFLHTTFEASVFHTYSMFSKDYIPNDRFSDVNVQTLSHHAGATIGLALPVPAPSDPQGFFDLLAQHNWNEDLNDDSITHPEDKAVPFLSFVDFSNVSRLIFPSIAEYVGKMFPPEQHKAINTSSNSPPHRSQISNDDNDLDYLEMPLPAYSHCRVDGNCSLDSICLKNRCAMKVYGQKLLTMRELYLYDSYLHASSQSAFLPSEFQLPMTPPSPNPQSASILSILLIGGLISLSLSLLTLGGVVCWRKRRVKKQILEQLQMQEFDDDDDDDDGDDDNSETDSDNEEE